VYKCVIHCKSNRRLTHISTVSSNGHIANDSMIFPEAFTGFHQRLFKVVIKVVCMSYQNVHFLFCLLLFWRKSPKIIYRLLTLFDIIVAFGFEFVQCNTFQSWLSYCLCLDGWTNNHVESLCLSYQSIEEPGAFDHDLYLLYKWAYVLLLYTNCPLTRLSVNQISIWKRSISPD
jgi:hypothetical protein